MPARRPFRKMFLARVLSNEAFEPVTAQQMLVRAGLLPVGARVYIFPDIHRRDPLVFHVRCADGVNALCFGGRTVRAPCDFNLPPDFSYGSAVVHHENEVFMIGSPWAHPRPGPGTLKRTRPRTPEITENEFAEVVLRDPLLSSADKDKILGISAGTPFSSKRRPAAASTGTFPGFGGK